jgi:hypothetical protein
MSWKNLITETLSIAGKTLDGPNETRKTLFEFIKIQIPILQIKKKPHE